MACCMWAAPTAGCTRFGSEDRCHTRSSGTGRFARLVQSHRKHVGSDFRQPRRKRPTTQYTSASDLQRNAWRRGHLRPKTESAIDAGMNRRPAPPSATYAPDALAPRSKAVDMGTLRAQFDYLRRWIGPLSSLLDGCDLGLTARRAAKHLSLESERCLVRHLRARRLPRFPLLRNWWFIIPLRDLSVEGTSLSSFALRNGKDPATYYRFVARVTGLSWSELKESPEWLPLSLAFSAWRPDLGPLDGFSWTLTDQVSLG